MTSSAPLDRYFGSASRPSPPPSAACGYARRPCRSASVLGDAELLAAAEVGGDLGGVDDVLARQAGDVRAGAADVPALDDRHLLSLGGEGPRQVFARFTTAQHDDVVFFGHGLRHFLKRPGRGREVAGRGVGLAWTRMKKRGGRGTRRGVPSLRRSSKEPRRQWAVRRFAVRMVYPDYTEGAWGNKGRVV